VGIGADGVVAGNTKGTVPGIGELRDEEQPGDRREAHEHRHGDDRHGGRIEHTTCVGDERLRRGGVAAGEPVHHLACQFLSDCVERSQYIML